MSEYKGWKDDVKDLSKTQWMYVFMIILGIVGLVTG